MLGSALWAPLRETVAALRTLGSRLRRLLELEKRPPMSSSASNENARRCLVHFILPAFGGVFPENTAPARFLLRRAQQKNKNIAAMAATTTGTATAACRADEQEMLLHDDFSDMGTAPLVLLAALVAVPDVWPLRLVVAGSEAPGVGDAEVAKVVDDAGEAFAVLDVPVLVAPEPVVVCKSLVVREPDPGSVVLANSLEKDVKRLLRLAVSKV